MRILLITSTYPTPVRPQQGAFNRVMVEALSRNHDVRVIAPIPWTQGWRRRTANEHPTTTLHPMFYYPPKVLRRHYGSFYWRSILSSIRELEQTYEPELVMGYWLHPDGASAVRAAERFGVPSIVLSGGTDLRVLSRQRERNAAITHVLDRADRLVVVSRELLTHAVRLGVPEGRVDVIYRGVDPTCFFCVDRASARTTCGLPNDASVILWAGRLEQVKNPEMLLHAAVSWKRTFGDRLRVVLVGDGALRKQLLRLRRRLELDDVVQLLSSVSQQELALYFNAANATVLTSHSEGIPNVLLESIACGTPFVATDVGGVAEIASPGIDRLVATEDISALAAAVEECVHESETTHPAPRRFVPSDLLVMAKNFDASIARATGMDVALGESRSTSRLWRAGRSTRLANR